MANVKHTTNNGEILTTNCKRVSTALKRFTEFLNNYDNIYNDMLSKLNSDNNTITFTDDCYNTITMALTVNDNNDNYTLTINHTHNAPRTIWCICNQDGNIKDFTDRKDLFEYAYKNNLYGDFETIWIEEKELKDEKHDYYETVDYETLDLYKIRTMLELDICDMKIINNTNNDTANNNETSNNTTESDTTDTNNDSTLEIISKLEKLFDTAEKYKNSYTWNKDNGNAQQRDHKEKQDSIEIFEWYDNGDKYTAEYTVKYTRNNVYAKGTYTKNDKQTTLTAIKNSYNRLLQAVQRE